MKLHPSLVRVVLEARLFELVPVDANRHRVPQVAARLGEIRGASNRAHKGKIYRRRRRRRREEDRGRG